MKASFKKKENILPENLQATSTIQVALDQLLEAKVSVSILLADMYSESIFPIPYRCSVLHLVYGHP